MTATTARASRSIRGRVMVLVGTGLAATLAVAAYISWVTLRDLEAQVDRQQRAMVASMARQLDVEADRKLARLYDVALDVRGETAAGPLVDLSERLRDVYLSSNEFDAIVVADRTGGVRGVTPADVPDVAEAAEDAGRSRGPAGTTGHPADWPVRQWSR